VAKWLQDRGDAAGAGFRYGAVLLLTTTVLLFTIAAPAADWSQAVAGLLTGGTLLMVAITSGAAPAMRRASIVLVGIVLLASTGLAGLGTVSRSVELAVTAVMAAIALPVLVAGLLRLLRARGVTIQAVMGALAIYLLVGVLFANVIGVVAEASSKPYFAQAGKGSQSQRAYFSITILTTTGLGDLTPATKGGRALTVVEELLGQLYLVTVVALVVSNVGRRPRQDGAGGATP
jgi:hypothetical protein